MKFEELLNDVMMGARVRQSNFPWQTYGLNDEQNFVCFVKPEDEPEDECFLDGNDLALLFRSKLWELVPNQD